MHATNTHVLQIPCTIQEWPTPTGVDCRRQLSALGPPQPCRRSAFTAIFGNDANVRACHCSWEPDVRQLYVLGSFMHFWEVQADRDARVRTEKHLDLRGSSAGFTSRGCQSFAEPAVASKFERTVIISVYVVVVVVVVYVVLCMLWVELYFIESSPGTA